MTDELPLLPKALDLPKRSWSSCVESLHRVCRRGHRASCGKASRCSAGKPPPRRRRLLLRQASPLLLRQAYARQPWGVCVVSGRVPTERRAARAVVSLSASDVPLGGLPSDVSGTHP
eukprot:3619417-Prymnesium_polylepis.1